MPGGGGASTAVGAKNKKAVAGPGRTRSGTITQSSYQASMGTRMGSDGKLVEIDNGLPLSPPKDDSDDELLLVGERE